jgi:hypothetical protein
MRANFWLKSPKGRNNSEIIEPDERIILKRILKKSCGTRGIDLSGQDRNRWWAHVRTIVYMWVS